MNIEAFHLHGLTTTKAPFIEQARMGNQLFIKQPYELYSEDNQQAWQKLYTQILPKWEKYANSKFLEGVERLALNANRIPLLEEINRFLKPLTGFQAKAVSGYVPTHLFFESLHRREFPTTITIRDSQQLDYLPEPDIFHDIAGHVPMHTDRVFADVLVKFGSLAKQAVKRQALVNDPQERMEKLASNLRALSRFFWFTVEFGLMKNHQAICVYGSGLLSSNSEIQHAIESPHVQRYPFQLKWVINQAFEINHFQPLLFIIHSFDHLFEEVNRLEQWLHSGRLDHVSPGEPGIDTEELHTFFINQVLH